MIQRLARQWLHPFLLGVVVACASPDEPAESLALRALDAIALEDSGRTALGLVGGFGVTHDGEFLVSDRQRGTLVHFARSGARLHEIGRRGEGPGEWGWGPFGILRYDDTTTLVSDGELLKALRLPSAEPLWSRRQSAMSPAFAAHRGVVLAKATNRDRRSTIARWRSAADSLEYGGPFPAPLGRSQMVDLMLVWVAAAQLPGDSLAVMAQGNDHLFVGPFAGPYDSMPLPVVTRRGAMRDVLDAVRDDDPESGMRAAYKASWPYIVQPLREPSRLAIVTIDQEFLGDRMAGDMNVAVLNRVRRRFCGELRVPVPRDPQPWATLVGDTLFVFAHEVDSLAADAQPVVRRYVIEARGC